MEDHYLRKTAAQVDGLLDQVIVNDERLDAIVTGTTGNYSLKAADDLRLGGVKVYNIIGGDIDNSYTGVSMEGTSKVLYVPKSYNSTITIQKNGSAVGSFTLNQNSGQNINITVPTVPSDIGAQAEITNNTKLSSDLVDDTNATNLFVTDTEKSTWNAKSDFSGSYNDLTDKPMIPTVNDNTITIQKNGVAVESFTLNQASNETINITVPTTASDVSALPASTKYGSSLTLSIDSSTYVVTATLKDQNGDTLGTAQTIDLPLETMVVSGSYDSQTKKIVLTLKNGQTVEFSVADLVSGLQTEITSQNKLSADLVDDTNATNKFVTASDKTSLSALESHIVFDSSSKTYYLQQTQPSNPQDGDIWIG